MRFQLIRRIVLTLALSLGALVLLGGAAVVWVVVERQWPALPPGFDRQVPAVGDLAPDFTLRDIDGHEFRLADHLGRVPIVLEFGSVTCLQCVLGAFDRKEAIAREYAGEVEFVFIYCREAHPDQAFGSMAMTAGNNPSQTFTWDERAERARSFRQKMNVGRLLLVDGNDEDSVQQLYGGRDNQLIVIDGDGQIAFKQPYTDHRELRRYLEEQVVAAE
jgi:hypothetical protein